MHSLYVLPFVRCQLHLSACQVAAGFDIGGGGGSFRSHFVKGFDLSAGGRRPRPEGGGDSRARVAADAPAAAEKLQVQLRGEGGSLAECGAAGKLAEMQWKQKGEERKED